MDIGWSPASIKHENLFDQFFQELMDVINDEESDLGLFKEILGDLFNSYIKDTIFYVKLGELYLAAYETDHDDYLLTLINTYQTTKIDEEVIPALSVFFTYTFPLELFRVVISELEPEYFELMAGLFSYPDDDGIDRAINNFDQLYQQPNAETIQKLLDRLKDVNAITTAPNVKLWDYLSNLLVEINEFAPIPDWVIRGSNILDRENDPEEVKIPEKIKRLYERGILPTKSELMTLLPPAPKATYVSRGLNGDIKHLYNLVSSSLGALEAKSARPTFNQIKDSMIRLSTEEREEKINWYYKNQLEMNLMNDPECHRILGGSFPIIENINRDTNSPDPCSRYGGCRSDVCYENHNYNEETEEMLIPDVVGQGRLAEIDWFTGSCHNCKKRIRKRCHAVRTVLVGGGWYLCFCSFKCVKEDLPEGEDVRLRLIGVFENIYNLFGVYDRIED